ncbi:hypothetical protein EQO05_04240 [Methanosarcina sp. MSH10X1]|uniref:hypothetical protein n=1 Tax=Methanosarcina sp. MSH10X1 TaxID=2507075 RepID=UPI000FFC0EB4|nr:hypothetical protein [Methanosarcina sp. MSH10X1]RXA20927.1 hypothetical protein EQO05_04240 [Methanosarcina sp. MSH10X1]
MDVNSNHQKRVLLCLLLIVLNVVIRIPSAPHEIGGDTYQLHTIANSITQFGEPRWWINWLSVIGMYTYSYASAVPFCLSGISQLTGIDMEITIYLYALFTGLLSAGTAYIMASTFYNEFTFKYLVSLFYSISAGVLAFTSWNASARGLFLVLFPLFIFILLKKFSSPWKKLCLIVLLFAFLRATHNFCYFTAPLILVYISIELLGKGNSSFKNSNLYKYQNYLYLLLTCFFFIIPFFTKLFIVGSKYKAVIDLVITTTRYLGPIVIFVIPGFVYLCLKSSKTKYENFILISTLFFIPMFYNEIYGKFITLPILVFYVAIAVKNMTINRNIVINKKMALNILLVLLICSLTMFSSFYSHFRTGSSENSFTMSEYTNAAGVWSRYYTNENSHVYTTNAEVTRMAAVSNGHIIVPLLPIVSLIYGYVSLEDVENTSIEVSPWSKDYYFDGAYSQKSGTLVWGHYNWNSEFGINDGRVKSMINKYNIKYVVEDKAYSPTKLTSSLNDEKDLIFSNGRVNIWNL